jgi:SAM-dependent methyltransferase
MTPMNASTPRSPAQQLQEDQYQLPYHYIPSLGQNRFAQHLYWDWGFRYLGGLHLVTEELRQLPFQSLIDVGCGDGRFLREVQDSFPGHRLMGVDYSERAIALASALNPRLRFAVLDVFRQNLEERFDVATLIEVLEHIPPDQLGDFVKGTQRLLDEQHTLLITVPHVNKPLVRKHFQHFDETKLRALLEKTYADLKFIPFDTSAARAPLLRLIVKLLGGKGKLFLVTDKRLLFAFYSFYLRRYLYSRNETDCERIAVICRK